MPNSWFDDSKPSDTSSRGHSDPMDVAAVNSLSRLARGKGHQVRVMGVSSAVVHIFNEIATHARAQASNRMAKVNRASHGPREGPHTAQVRVRKTREHQWKISKDPKVRTKVPKAHTKAMHRKLVSQVLKTRDHRQALKLRNRDMSVPLTPPGTMVGIVTNGMMAGVLMSGMMTGVLLHGTKGGNKRMTLPQAHFRLEVWMLGPE